MPTRPEPSPADIDAALLRIEQADTREAKAAARQRAMIELGVNRSQLYEWLKRWRTTGAHAVVERRGWQKGKPRRIVTPRFDREMRAIGVPDDRLVEIAAELRQLCDSAYNSSIKSGREVQTHAQRWLTQRARREGLQGSDAKIWRTCKVPMSFVRRSRHRQVLYIRTNDAPTYAADYRYRGRRPRDGLWPGAVVCIDCTALDILLRDADGREWTARLVVFQDLATNRLFLSLVPARGVTQAHIARALLEWIKRFGVPAIVLVDNGSEFKKLDMLDDLYKLAAGVGVERFAVHNGDAKPDLTKLLRARMVDARQNVINALPYNPQAKPVEGQIGNLMRFVFAPIEGYIGGDRQRQPTKNQGRRAVHFDGTIEELQQALEAAMAWYDNLPQSGHLKGRSPAEAYADAVAAGYEQVDANIDQLIEFWSERVNCHVRQGVITVRGVGRYRLPKLGTLLLSTRAEVAVPILPEYRDRLAVYDEYGDLLGHAEPMPPHHFLGLEGARDGQRFNAAIAAELDAMVAETRPFDPIEARAQFVALQPVVPRAPSAGVAQVDRRSREAAKARKALPAPGSTASRIDPMGLWAAFARPAPANATAGGVDPPAASPARARAGTSVKPRSK